MASMGPRFLNAEGISRLAITCGILPHASMGLRSLNAAGISRLAIACGFLPHASMGPHSYERGRYQPPGDSLRFPPLTLQRDRIHMNTEGISRLAIACGFLPHASMGSRSYERGRARVINREVLRKLVQGVQSAAILKVGRKRYDAATVATFRIHASPCMAGIHTVLHVVGSDHVLPPSLL